FVGLQRSGSRTLHIVSLSEDSQREIYFEMKLADLELCGAPLDCGAAQALVQREPVRHWAAYVAGVFLALMREQNVVFKEGARILIDSRVPEGKGVSSSAALEVAVMQAVAGAYDLSV